MHTSFLTIKEAAAKSGRSEITIRRLIHRIAANPKHKDRIWIQPLEKDKSEYVKAGKPFAWRISEELLQKAFVEPATTPQPPHKDTRRKGEEVRTPDHEDTHDHPHRDLRDVGAYGHKPLQIFEKQLEVKDEQIAALTALVNSLGNQLNERLRESNVLMKGLQERMALPAPHNKAHKEVIEDVTEAVTAKHVKKTLKQKSPAPKAAAKAGFWKKMFG